MTYLTGRPFFKSRAIRGILRAKTFDVIHFHNISLIGGPALLRYGTAVKLYTMHEHWLICPTHVLFKLNREVCTQRACVRCELAYRRPPQLWRATNLLTRSLPHVDAFLSPSRFTMRRHFAAGLQVPIVHLPPGLRMGSEDPSSREDETPPDVPPRPFFLFVGRLEKLKGIQTVIPLFRETPVADLVIAGTGSYDSRLRQLAAGSPHVHFLGWRTGSQLRQLYKQALAVIMPSLTFEVFPLVLLEAFAMGTPVVVRDLGPLPEIVAESNGGLVYRDAAELKHALSRIRNDSVLRHRLGEAGQRTYQARWTVDVHVERYLGLVERIRAQKLSLGTHTCP
jgi:glycosyltransferase involved in cell wall biosynthesis